jgi:hypothetical protein
MFHDVNSFLRTLTLFNVWLPLSGEHAKSAANNVRIPPHKNLGGALPPRPPAKRLIFSCVTSRQDDTRPQPEDCNSSAGNSQTKLLSAWRGHVGGSLQRSAPRNPSNAWGQAGGSREKTVRPCACSVSGEKRNPELSLKSKSIQIKNCRNVIHPKSSPQNKTFLTGQQ